MIKSIFLNMPVADLPKSRTFFEALGFTFDEQFSGDHAACLNIGPNIRAMLGTHATFGGFIDKPIADKSTNEVIISLECESADVVTQLSEKAFAQGARRVNDPEDQDFMFSWGFEDLDGHIWDLFWLKS